MKKFFFPIILLFVASSAHAEMSRLDEISRALDAFDQKLNKACDDFARFDATKKQQLPPRKIQTLEIGYEPYFYRYWESIGVTVSGMMNSVYGNYTYRPPEDNPMNNSVLNAYRFELRYAAGSGKYKSDSGTMTGDKNYNLEMRWLGAKEMVIENIWFMPYLGFGYRFLYNPGNGKFTDLGKVGYDRRSRYYYLPMGMTISMPHLYGHWSGALNGEYDLFLGGQQLSDLNETTPYTGVEAPSMSNRQTEGFGVRGSFKLTYSTPRVDFFVEPFIRFWNIQDSKIKTEYLHDGVSTFTGLEPHNTTQEIGSKLGVQF